ncbi:hypothetical protein [Nostoc sphaeroides]|uniref:Uncharacterized protein n=1 Tax=Nostoc sphaeroides CCNUC1 TaxID=2653204 RepID=A0A5P8W7R3_9NOSO|nr:hypothetical protein [Nostoc sphaeroides]QFS48817.1 hypothetical protein GXM_06311 [Nostoc sphaeroides CCNUC1]
MQLSAAQANLKLALWNAEAESVKSNEMYIQLQELGLPEEVVTRLHGLSTVTRKVSGKVFTLGKIVLIKIFEFVKAHPFLVAGVGIGAVVGAAIAGLITSIPLLGQLLAPIAAVLGITIIGVGAVVGHRLDKQFQGVGEDIVEIAQKFFALLTDVLNTVFGGILPA